MPRSQNSRPQSRLRGKRGNKHSDEQHLSAKQVERGFHNKLDFEERAQASEYLERMHEQIDDELGSAAKRALMQVSSRVLWWLFGGVGGVLLFLSSLTLYSQLGLR